MKRILCVAALFLVWAGSLHAQPEFVYVNNGTSPFNSISAFSVGAGGTLVPVPGSPFPTGGDAAGGLFASTRITTCIIRNHLYVANDGSNTITVMTINAATGVLSPVPGSPFPTGGDAGSDGLSLAVTPDDRFLYAGNGASSNISVFAVAANGALAPIPGSPFPLGREPNGMKVTPDGRFLLVGILPVPGVAVLSLAANGTPTQVPGSPFPGGGDSVDADCAGQFVFAPQANVSQTIVYTYNRLAGGQLSPVPGSPFQFASGANSNVGVLSVDDRFLFVSNQYSNTMTVLAVAPNGSLSLVPGSPFPIPGGAAPTLIAVDPRGSYLYVANNNGNVTGFSIAGNGSLAPVPGSPFNVGAGQRAGVVVFPPKSCVTICTASNVAPGFTAPTPACGSTRVALVGTPVSFGVAASDPDSGDVVTLSATGVPGGASFTPPLPASANPVSSTFQWTPGLADQGLHLVTFIATDLCGHATRCSTSVQVTTNRSPDCSAAVASPNVLWPADHKMKAITISGVTDPDGDPVTVTVTGITQDEPINASGDGNTCPDGEIVNGQASVRAERTGVQGTPGNGRVYGIAFVASDGKGGSCTDTVYVCVPRNQGDPSCVDDGQVYNSLTQCSRRAVVTELTLAVTQTTATQVTVEFTLPQDTQVEMSAFDLAGRRVATIEKGVLASGVYQRAWDMHDAPRGMYFVRLRAGNVSMTKSVLKIQ